MDESSSSRTAVDTIADLARKWPLILPFAIVTPLVAFAITASQPSVHSSSADVLLNRQAFVVSGLRDPTFYYPNRAQLTQARLARLPEVAQRVVDAAGLADRGRYGFLAQSWVGAGGGTDVMTFNVSDRDPELASRLATTYAEAYIAYRRELDTQSLSQAIAVVGQQDGAGTRSGSGRIRGSRQQATAAADRTGLPSKTNAILVRPGGIAEQVAPKTVRLLALRRIARSHRGSRPRGTRAAPRSAEQDGGGDRRAGRRPAPRRAPSRAAREARRDRFRIATK